MGGGGSKATSETVIDSTVVNENVFKALNSSRNMTNSSVIVNQLMEISNFKAMSCVPSIKQSATIDVKVLAEFEQSDAADLSSMIATNLDQAVKENSSSESGFGDVMSGGSETDSYTEIKTNVENRMSTELTNEVINEIRTEIVANQTLRIENTVFDPLFFELNAKWGYPLTLEERRLASQTVCPIDQDLAIRFVSEQIGKKVSTIIQEVVQQADLSTDFEKTTESKTEGAGEAVADAAEGIGAGVATAAEGIGDGAATVVDSAGDAAAGVLTAGMIPFAVGSGASVIIMMMMMMMMSKKGGGMDPAMLALLARK
jgi:hypothetical protein